jgi:hypothetical protein
MKISSNWLNVENRKRSANRVQYREIERIHISDDGRIVILAKGQVREFESKAYEDDRQRLMITDVTNENLLDLYLQIQQVLFNKIK